MTNMDKYKDTLYGNTVFIDGNPVEQLHELVKLAKSEMITIEYFCTHYESIFNFSLVKSQVENKELERLSRLFDRVVWFSPFPEEVKQYPSYVGEPNIKALLAQLF